MLYQVFRKKALEVLGTSDFHIMTKDNILMMLPPVKELSECLGECIVETGKNVGAHFVTQGSVRKIGKKLTFTASLFDTKNNQLLGSLNIRAKEIDDLIDSLVQKAPTLFKSLQPEPEEKLKVSFKEMILVKAGCFQKTTIENTKNDSLKSKVCVGDFQLDVHEVTLGDYKVYKRYHRTEFWNCGSSCPVDKVTWFDANSYCKSVNKRLPTENEWEFAARGGVKSKGFIYAGSDNQEDVAWHRGNSSNKPRPVCQKQKNELGLCDMSGNLWEWVSDKDSLVNEDKSQSVKHVMKGGSWFDVVASLKASKRSSNLPEKTFFDLGFRCAY
jgi:formylglycine-generating enzyme